MNEQDEFKKFLEDIKPDLEKKIKKHKTRICIGCGEKYDLSDPIFEESGSLNEEGELYSCGECGCDMFIIKSKNPLIGFVSIEHYESFQEIIPERLRRGPKTIRELTEIIHYKQAANYLSIK